jgi:hypothetical protein
MEKPLVFSKAKPRVTTRILLNKWQRQLEKERYQKRKHEEERRRSEEEARRRELEDHVWFEDRWMVASLCDE